MQEIGQQISERKGKLGLTQEELAEKANVTVQLVLYAEVGKRAMRPENLKKLSETLGVSTDYLLTGEIVDEDLLILSDKMRTLSPSMLRIVENIIDECISLFATTRVINTLAILFRMFLRGTCFCKSPFVICCMKYIQLF